MTSIPVISRIKNTQESKAEKQDWRNLFPKKMPSILGSERFVDQEFLREPTLLHASLFWRLVSRIFFWMAGDLCVLPSRHNLYDVVFNFKDGGKLPFLGDSYLIMTYKLVAIAIADKPSELKIRILYVAICF